LRLDDCERLAEGIGLVGDEAGKAPTGDGKIERERRRDET